MKSLSVVFNIGSEEFGVKTSDSSQAQNISTEAAEISTIDI